MKKLVLLGIGVSSILSAAVLADGSSVFHALSDTGSGQQAPPAMRESSLAAIEGGFPFPFMVIPGGLPDDLPQCNHCNVTSVQHNPVCQNQPCGSQTSVVTINQINP